MPRTKVIFYSVLFAVLAIVAVVLSLIKVTYRVEAQGMVMPAYQWTLMHSTDGNLISNLKDNFNGTTKSYSVTEFQRGDFVSFNLKETILDGAFVKKGDTIGFIYSNEENRKLIQLEGQLEVLKSELEFFTTGQKPEDVLHAERELALALQEFKTQKKLFDRSQQLFRDSVISIQELEISENELMVKELGHKIALARLESVTTGEKPEQEKLVRSKIAAIEDQISQVRERLDFFTLTSPVSGFLMHNRGAEQSSHIVNVADTTSYVILMPVQRHEYNYLREGHRIVAKYLRSGSSEGQIIGKDNVIRIIDNRQAFYLTGMLPAGNGLLPGGYEQFEILADEVSGWEFVLRALKFGIN